MQLGLSPDRSYGDVDDLCATERTRRDAVDAVAIMTPNDMHYPQTVTALDGFPGSPYLGRVFERLGVAS